jgi:hypothetical protein
VREGSVPSWRALVSRGDIEILDDGDGFVLSWKGPSENYSNDTWHQTVDAALEAASLSFGIEPDE